MRILIEHTITTPYTPETPHGGTERFTHQALLALRAAGHDAWMFVTSDTDRSIPFTINSEVVSPLKGKAEGDSITHYKEWYAALDIAARDFDYVILSTEFSSRSLFKNWSFYRKAVLINHFCHGGMVRGQAGFRFQWSGRWLRQCGGRCFSSGASNVVNLNFMWNNPVTQKALIQYNEYVERLGIDRNIDLFEGWVDVNVIPHDRAEFALINQKKVIAIGRPVPEKNTLLAAQALAELADLGFECHVFTTDIGQDFDAIRQIGKIKHHVNAPHAEIMRHVADARCLLFPSKSETNGIVAFEAASHGVPVIYQCDEPDFFLQPSGLGHKYEASKNKKEVIASLVQFAQEVQQTDEERYEKRSYFDQSYSEEALVKKLVGRMPTGTTSTVSLPAYEPAKGKQVTKIYKTGKKANPVHPTVNEVTYEFLNENEIPEVKVGVHHLYEIRVMGAVGYGETNNTKKRISGGYADHIRTMGHDGSTLIKKMQQMAVENGNRLHFTVRSLPPVFGTSDREAKQKARVEETRLALEALARGELVLNSVKAPKEPKPKVIKSRQPKPVKIDSKGGGWQVKAEWIGQGLKVRCKSPYDGTFWECDHDTLVERINASLRAKGKPCIGEPGPSEKQYGASSGLREQEIWTRI